MLLTTYGLGGGGGNQVGIAADLLVVQGHPMLLLDTTQCISHSMCAFSMPLVSMLSD